MNYLVNELSLDMSDILMIAPALPLNSFPLKQVTDTKLYSDGSYDLFAPEVITLGSLIRELRMEQKISQQALCYGLCSKSKLSKIENNTLQPSVILAETLLQRLGISDRAFTFYGDDKEAILHDIRIKISFSPSHDFLSANPQISNALLLAENNLYQQYFLYRHAIAQDDNVQKINELLDALRITQPDFNFTISSSMSFSLCELNILNHLCAAYTQQAMPIKGILLYYQLLEYLLHYPRDILDKKRIISIFLAEMSSNLFATGHFAELCDLSPYFVLPAMKGYVYYVGIAHANYAQALGKCKRINELPINCCYAYYNFLITKSKHATLFQKEILQDWGYHLD